MAKKDKRSKMGKVVHLERSIRAEALKSLKREVKK